MYSVITLYKTPVGGVDQTHKTALYKSSLSQEGQGQGLVILR